MNVVENFHVQGAVCSGSGSFWWRECCKVAEQSQIISIVLGHMFARALVSYDSFHVGREVREAVRVKKQRPAAAGSGQ